MRGARGTAPLGLVLAAALLVVPVAGVPLVEAPSAAAAGQPLPSSLSLKPRVTQLVTVTSHRWSDTRATLRAWSRTDDGWELVRGPVRVRLGYNGWVRGKARKQGSGTTPGGSFAMPYTFGNRVDPGTSMRYRHTDKNDVWPYEPRDKATYNIYQRRRAKGSHWRSGYQERLRSYGREYAYAVVLGFNLPTGVHWSKKRKQSVARHPADTSRGGGIFLHVQGSDYTAGCVAGPLPQIRGLVRWLDPERSPRIVMGPTRWVKKKF